MQEVIEILLQKKAVLNADMQAEKELALLAIDEKYAERAKKIDELLTVAGYEEPAADAVCENVDEVVDGKVDEVATAEEVAEPATVQETVIY